jgi:tetraacyldisaccharide 4'-kinase
MREPAFWWRNSGILPGLLSTLLAPVAAGYGIAAARRMRGQGPHIGARAGVPVICVGNFTLGGSGKTPTAIAIAGMLAAAGHKPALLTRGYGGAEAGPVIVDPHHDDAAKVGDEALLLAQAAPTIVARDRVAGASTATANGADVIVMDDGLQNPSLQKDFSIAVVDGSRGVGNGRVFPAGPLRAPLAAQFACVDALLVIGGSAGAAGLDNDIRTRRIPVFHGELEPDRAAIDAAGGRPVLAFAGIGNPDKFFATVTAAGIEIAERRAFADHHRYSGEEAGDLVMQAERRGLRLLTTAKDHARMSGDPNLAALRARAHVLPVRLKVKEEAAWRDVIVRAAR